MAMEKTLFIGDVPIETPISSGFPIATFDYRRVTKFDAIVRYCGAVVAIAELYALYLAGPTL